MSEGFPTPKPRSWPELRERVLEDGYLSLDELRYRQRKARATKRGLWLAPLCGLGVGLAALQDGGLAWYLWVTLALAVYAALTFYRVGRTWERRWDELIHERTAADTPQ